MAVTTLLPPPAVLIAATGTPGPWVIVSAVALVALYLMLRSGYRKRKDPLERPPSQTSLAQQRSVERQMQNLLVELSQMAQQITAQLDTRSTKLALMIDDADEKAVRLQRLLDDCRAAVAAAGTPPAVTPAAAIDAPAPLPPTEPSIALPDGSEFRHRQVYALADQGRSAPDIARQLQRLTGEIELILALRPR